MLRICEECGYLADIEGFLPEELTCPDCGEYDSLEIAKICADCGRIFPLGEVKRASKKYYCTECREERKVWLYELMQRARQVNMPLVSARV